MSPAVGLGKRRFALIALLYVLLTLLLSYPRPLHLTTRLFAGGTDPQLWLWTLAWDTHAFTHQPWAIFDANIFYPGHHALAYSENLIGSAFLAAPIIWLSRNSVLAMNLVELSSIVLSAIGTYLLARRAGLRQSSAVLAGMVFAFAPARFLRITQFHLTTVQWVPFGLAFLYSYLHGGRKADLRWFLLFFSLQAITSGHGAVFLQVASAILILHRLAQGEPLALGRRLRDVGVPGALLLGPPALLYLAYRAARTEAPALARALDDYGVSTASYFASPAHFQQFVLSHAPSWMTTPEADASLFQGYLPLLLSIVAIAWIGRERAHAGTVPSNRRWLRAAVLVEVSTVLLAAAAAVASWSGASRLKLSSGTVLISARHPWRIWLLAAALAAVRIAMSSRAPIGIVMRVRRLAGTVSEWWRARCRDAATPFALITLVSAWLTLGPPFGLWRWVYWLPVFSFLRVPSRFVILVMLGLAILAGFGFERMTTRLAPLRRSIAATIVGVLLIGEFAAIPLGSEPFRVDPPPIDRWLDAQPKPFVVAEVPMPRTTSPPVVAIFNARYMLHSTAHWQKTVHGFSGAEPPFHTLLYLQMSRFPDDESVQKLTDLGVTYVIVHPEFYRGSEQAEAESRMLRYADWLTLLHVEGPDRVYSLHKPR